MSPRNQHSNPVTPRPEPLSETKINGSTDVMSTSSDYTPVPPQHTSSSPSSKSTLMCLSTEKLHSQDGCQNLDSSAEEDSHLNIQNDYQTSSIAGKEVERSATFDANETPVLSTEVTFQNGCHRLDECNSESISDQSDSGYKASRIIDTPHLTDTYSSVDITVDGNLETSADLSELNDSANSYHDDLSSSSNITPLPDACPLVTSFETQVVYVSSYSLVPVSVNSLLVDITCYCFVKSNSG